MKTLAMSMLLFVVSLLIATCGGSDGSSSTPTDSFSDTSTTTGEAGDFSMGGGSLGGNAVTTLLAQEVLTIEETAGSLAWVAHEIRLDDGESLEHSHEFAFVYAKEKPHVLTKTAEGRQLRPAEAAVIPSGMLHRHGAVDSPSLFWEVRLAAPGSAPPPNTSNARTLERFSKACL